MPKTFCNQPPLNQLHICNQSTIFTSCKLSRDQPVAMVNEAETVVVETIAKIFSVKIYTQIRTSASEYPAGIYAYIEYPVGIYAYIEYPGGIYAYIEYPGGIYAYIEYPGGIYAYIEYPGGIHAYIEYPGGIHAYIEYPGGARQFSSLCLFLFPSKLVV